MLAALTYGHVFSLRKISWTEMPAMQSLGVTKSEIDQVLDEFDTNNDGEIDYHGESNGSFAGHSNQTL